MSETPSSLQCIRALFPELPDPPIPDEDDEDYEPTPYEVAVASYRALDRGAPLTIPPPPTDPDIVHPNVRDAIEADSDVSTLLNAMPSTYDPVTKFYTVVGALFPLWLQLEKYMGPRVLDQAKLSLATICDLAQPFTLPAPEPIQVGGPPVAIPPTSGTPSAPVADAVMAEASPDRAVTPTPRPKEKGKMKAKVTPSPVPPPTVPPTAQPPTASAQGPKAPKAMQKVHASHAPPPPLSYAKVAAPSLLVLIPPPSPTIWLIPTFLVHPSSLKRPRSGVGLTKHHPLCPAFLSWNPSLPSSTTHASL